MTSATPLRSAQAQSSSPNSAAESFSLSEPIMCVVQLKHQRDGVVHQVVLDPAKVKDGLIRLGDWPGDEANGWQLTANVTVLAVLGRAERTEKGTQVTPIVDTSPDPVDG